MKLKLHWQILIAMIIGSVIGFIYQAYIPQNERGIVYSIIVSLGTVFIRLLKMVIIPLIFASIVSGVAGIGDSKSIGRLGLKTITYYFVTSLIAILIGLLLTNLIQPGVGANIDIHSSFDYSNIKKPESPLDIIIRMVPVNPIKSAAAGDMLGLIFFSIIIGMGITAIKKDYSNKLKDLFNAGFDLMMKVTEVIIKFAPLGVLGLITKSVSNTGFELFRSIAKYIFTVATGLSIHFLIILPVIFYLMTGINPKLHFKAMASVIATAFSTSSSNATLPLTMRSVEKNAGVSNKISSFVLPLGATVNMNGTALYECAGVIFIAQILGIKLTILQQFVIVITALLASIGTAGVPSASLVTIFIITQAIGFKDADVAIIIGTILAVDRPLDMYRTVVNVFGDSVGAVVIAKSEGETNLYKNLDK